MHTYYEQKIAADASDFASTSKSGISQNIDDAFREHVWRQLVTLSDIKVAFLRKFQSAEPLSSSLPQKELDGPPVYLDTRDLSVPDQGKFNLVNKQLIKATRKDKGKHLRDARLAREQWEFCELSRDEVSLSSRQNLVENYGAERLRVAVDPDTSYVALTGSHDKVSFKCLKI